MSDFQRSIAMALAKLAQSGTQVYLMHGNRDFLLGRAFCRLARCQLLEDPTVIELNGHRVLLSHGDAFCTQDLAYMRMRRWLRNPLSSCCCAICRWQPARSSRASYATKAALRPA